MKQSMKSKTVQKHRPARKMLTKSVFRYFNRKPLSWQHEKITLLVDKAARAGKAFIDVDDRIIISYIFMGRVIIIVIPAEEVRGWCGNEPHPLPPLPPLPDPNPEPDPCPTPHHVWLDKEQRKTVGSYLSAMLKEHQEAALHLSQMGNGFHTIPIGGKANLHIMGKV